VACTLSILAFLLKGWLSEDSVRLAGRHKDLANGAAVFREIVYYDDNEDFGPEEKASHNSRNSKGVPVNPNNQIDITVDATGPSEDEKIRRFQSAIPRDGHFYERLHQGGTTTCILLTGPVTTPILCINIPPRRLAHTVIRYVPQDVQ